MILVVAGNPVDGFTFHGLFDTPEEAIAWAERECDGDWWLATVRKAQ